MSRMKRIAAIVLMTATLASAGSVLTAGHASAATAYKPDTCGDFCR